MTVSSQVRADTLTPSAASSSAEALLAADAQFLAAFGKHVRALRKRRGLTRKLLACQADVSERYLGQLESGEGNVSLILLRRIASALHITPGELLTLEQQESVGHQRIALIGLRGAGKTTLGEMLARDLHLPFIELDGEVERETGLPLSEIFTLYGQSGYRRIEHRCLERVLTEYGRAIIAIGGGVVSEEDTFQLLRAQCHTLWLKATPEEHMVRVVAQGDLRPMAGNSTAIEDLKRILTAREPLYRKADVIIDTSGRTVDESFHALRQALRNHVTDTNKGGSSWNPQS
jgi:XRE family transcriptional regulator, aerobic/anaerobic benzoate catabolism transcriptional regulator